MSNTCPAQVPSVPIIIVLLDYLLTSDVDRQLHSYEIAIDACEEAFAVPASVHEATIVCNDSSPLFGFGESPQTPRTLRKIPGALSIENSR